MMMQSTATWKVIKKNKKNPFKFWEEFLENTSTQLGLTIARFALQKKIIIVQRNSKEERDKPKA